METNIASCNFTKYIKLGPNRWQHCPVVRGCPEKPFCRGATGVVIERNSTLIESLRYARNQEPRGILEPSESLCKKLPAVTISDLQRREAPLSCCNQHFLEAC